MKVSVRILTKFAYFNFCLRVHSQCKQFFYTSSAQEYRYVKHYSAHCDHLNVKYADILGNTGQEFFFLSLDSNCET